MKFKFEKELITRNIYIVDFANIPPEELEPYFFDEDRDEDAIEYAVLEWFDDQGWAGLTPAYDEIEIGHTVGCRDEHGCPTHRTTVKIIKEKVNVP